MAELSGLPSWADPALTDSKAARPTLEQNYYAFLKSIVQVIADRDATIAAQAQTIADHTAQIEILRVALNEVRQDPTTVYPVIPAF